MQEYNAIVGKSTRFKSVNKKVAEDKMFIEGSKFPESGEKQRPYFTLSALFQ
jgi:hypothetical protein